MFHRFAIPLAAGVAAVLWLALPDTPALAQQGHGDFHHGYQHATLHVSVHPHTLYGQGTHLNSSYIYTPYQGYGGYRSGVYAGNYAYRPNAYRPNTYRGHRHRPQVRGCR